MKDSYQFIINERRVSLTKPMDGRVWIGTALANDADGDPIVLARTDDGKHSSDFWLTEWMSEMARVCSHGGCRDASSMVSPFGNPLCAHHGSIYK